MAPGAGTGYALIYNRHMYEYGTTQEQMAKVAADQRFNAVENPNAVFNGQTATVQDVLNSRYVNYPLRLLECVMPCDGAAALVITTPERAKALPNRPAYLLGAGYVAIALLVSALSQEQLVAFLVGSLVLGLLWLLRMLVGVLPPALAEAVEYACPSVWRGATTVGGGSPCSQSSALAVCAGNTAPRAAPASNA